MVRKVAGLGFKNFLSVNFVKEGVGRNCDRF